MNAWEKNVRKVTPYTPGEQPKVDDVIKLNTNECPYPPSPKVVEALENMNKDKLRLYPDPDATELVDAIAEYYNVNSNQVFVGVGSDDVIGMAFLTFFNSDKPILFPDITYSFYPVYCELYQMAYKLVKLDRDFKINLNDFMQPNSGIIFPNPNAPTGLLVDLDFIETILKNNPDSIVVIDEAYIDFGGTSCVSLIDKYDNLVVTQTYSKSRSLAGIRLGIALGSKEAIRHLYDVKNSFNSYPVDYVAQQICLASILDDQDTKAKCAKVIKTREMTKTRLKELGFIVPDSYANFVFVKHPDVEGQELFTALRQVGIIVRHWNTKRIDQYLRISIGTDEEMERMINFLEEYLNK